eukprot:g4223.t1
MAAPKSEKAIILSKEDQGIIVLRPEEKAVNRQHYKAMTVDDFLDEYEEKYMDEDFMALVAEGELTKKEKIKMMMKKENGTYKRVYLTDVVKSRAENLCGKELKKVKDENEMRTFKEKQKRRIAIGTRDEPFVQKVFRIMSCGPTPGKLPHPSVQAKFLDKVVRSDYAAVQKALKFNQPVNYCDKLNRSGLYLATYYGYTTVVQLLCGYSADPNICDLEKEMTAAHVAAQKGYGDILDILLDRGSDLTMRDKMGLTPLMHAANNGHYKTCMLIVECDIKIDMVDKRRWSALHYASQKGFHRIAKYLAAQGWDSHLKDVNGQTPLDLAEMELQALQEMGRGLPESEARELEKLNEPLIKNYEKVVAVMAEDMKDWRDLEAREEQKRLERLR